MFRHVKLFPSSVKMLRWSYSEGFPKYCVLFLKYKTTGEVQKLGNHKMFILPIVVAVERPLAHDTRETGSCEHGNKMTNVFRVITPCGASKNRRFAGTYRLHLQANETLETSQLASRVCLTTNGEEILLLRHLHSRVYPLPWSYCSWAVASSNVSN
jgi:hypothetical protein